MAALALTYDPGAMSRFNATLQLGMELELLDFMLVVREASAPLAALTKSVRESGGHVRYLHLAAKVERAHLHQPDALPAFACLACEEPRQRSSAVDAIITMLKGLRASEVETIVLHAGPLLGKSALGLRQKIEISADQAPLAADLLGEIRELHERLAGQALDALCRSLHEIELSLDGMAKLAICTPSSPLEWCMPGELEAVLDDGRKRGRGYWHRTCAAAQLGRLGVCAEDLWYGLFSAGLAGVSLADCIGLEGGQAPGLGDVDFKRVAKGIATSTPQVLEMAPDTSVTKLKFGCDVLREQGLMR